MKKFDVLNIDLNGKNLVEASAGTGKTYAIGILVLRLLLESKIKIEQILMVTYTNAAVDELELRIRKFINEAILYARNISECEDELIKLVIKKSIENQGIDITIKLLNEAIEFLDETSIFTIHGFCKRVLTDYAFENSMLLNTEIIDDQTRLIDDAAAEYWRRNVTVISPPILKKMLEKNFSFKKIKEIYLKITNGAKLRIKNIISPEDHNNIYDKLYQKSLNQHKQFKYVIEKNWLQIQGLKIGQLKSLKAAVDNNSLDDFEEIFLSSFKSKPDSPILQKLDFLFTEALNVIDAENSIQALIEDIIATYYQNAVDFIENNIESKKNRNKLVSFYDLIKILHNTVVKNQSLVLKKELNYKYKAIFIDEFQDTDKMQYEIFQNLFIEHSDTILYFIGDPKQSIYAFRGADLDTYNLAKSNLKDSLYSMNTNFRSTKYLLHGINEFFGTINVDELPISDSLNYVNIEFGNDSLGDLHCKGIKANSFEILTNTADQNNSENPNQKLILENLAGDIVELLSNGTIYKKNEHRNLKPSDIGILVRANLHGKLIKDKLASYNIPAIVVDDTKVLETTEARDLYFLLYAIYEPDHSSINRALLTNFTNFNTDQVKKLKFELVHDLFIDLQYLWNKSGVYSAVSGFIKNFNIRSILLSQVNPGGKRTYTNLIQLAEILNEKEIFDGLSPLELLDWLQRAIQGDKNAGKYEQVLEDDENSIQIVTAHKSKGLSYNIVILPFFNLVPKTTNNYFVEYKNDEGQKIISIYNDEEEKQYQQLIEDQENERLLYVAITRAVYKCMIFYNNKEGILKKYIDRLGNEPKYIVYRSSIDEPKISFKYSDFEEKTISEKARTFNTNIDISWKITSYSSLTSNKEYIPHYSEKNFDSKDSYDEFTFSSLEKGVQTGLIIHKLLEKINFSNPGNHRFLITKILDDFGKIPDESEIDHYILLLSHILNTDLSPIEFKLNQLNNSTKLTELEFYFSLDRFKTSELNSILPHLNLSYTEIEGVMHGFIDLVFEYDKKFYILDWKTNHLGYSIEDYEAKELKNEIIKNNYDLQYLIYTIALIRFLKSIKQDFDYERDFGGIFYLFVRGIRQNSNCGIYFEKPDHSQILTLESLI
jgi:exodeoxyribonuclease V beta subunit